MKRKVFTIIIMIGLMLLILGNTSYATEYKDANNYFKITFPDDYNVLFNDAIGQTNEASASGMIIMKGEALWMTIMTVKKDIGQEELSSTPILNGCTRGDILYARQNHFELAPDFGGIIDGGSVLFHISYGNTMYGNPWQRESWGLNIGDQMLDSFFIESDDYITGINIGYHGNPETVDFNNMTINDWFWNSEEEWSIINSFQYITNNTNIVCNLDFEDVRSTDWFCDATRYSYKNNIISGYDKWTFAPFDNLTREQLVTILWRIDGKPDASNLSNNFTDVKNGEWYTDAIKWANANKIVKGYGGTTKFGCGDKIIRQDLAIMLTNYAKYKEKYTEPTGTLDNFTDKNVVSDYAQDAVKWAVGNKIISGNANSDGTKTIAPLANAMRCEAAVMIYKFCENVLK